MRDGRGLHISLPLSHGFALSLAHPHVSRIFFSFFFAVDPPLRHRPHIVVDPPIPPSALPHSKRETEGSTLRRGDAATTWGPRDPATGWGPRNPPTAWGPRNPTTTWGPRNPTTTWGPCNPATGLGPHEDMGTSRPH